MAPGRVLVCFDLAELTVFWHKIKTLCWVNTEYLCSILHDVLWQILLNYLCYFWSRSRTCYLKTCYFFVLSLLADIVCGRFCLWMLCTVARHLWSALKKNWSVILRQSVMTLSYCSPHTRCQWRSAGLCCSTNKRSVLVFDLNSLCF